MEQSLKGPYFESDETDSDLLTPFKYLFFIDIPPEGYSPFQLSDEENKQELCNVKSYDTI
jgi:hypothetical protein